MPKASSPSPLARLLTGLADGVGFLPTRMPGVKLMRVPQRTPLSPVSYEPSLVIVAQGWKQGRLGGRTFRYDARNYLVLALPLPFECATFGSPEEPFLGLGVRVDPALVAELLLQLDPLPEARAGSPRAVDAEPMTEAMEDAALRLAKALGSEAEAAVLGPQIVREMVYRALLGGRGAALRALATPRSGLGQIARALRRIHADFGGDLGVEALAREAGMSLSTFHAKFKAVTAKPPLRYLQTIRLHKAQVLLAAGETVANAARTVGYESPSQFSREFKRLFGGAPREIAGRHRAALSMF